MSINLFASFEKYNSKANQWEDANLYEKKPDGTYSMADIIYGGRSYSDCIMGKEAFDYIGEDEQGKAMYQKRKLLDELQEFIRSKYINEGEPSDASDTTRDIFDRIRQRVVDPILYPYCPPSITYTLGDLMYIKNTAALISEEAEIFYDENFKKLEEALSVIARAHYVFMSKDIRVVLWVQ